MTEDHGDGSELIHIQAGMMAEMEGLAQKYEMATKRLLALHREALALINEEGMAYDQIKLTPRLHEVRIETVALMAEMISDTDGSYITYLINQLHLYQNREIEQGARLNILAATLNEMAVGYDMVPIYQGGHVDLGNLDETTFVTSSGQVLHNVHAKENCAGFCVIHNPIAGPWKDWEVLWRGDDLFDMWRGFERICPCGVGHTAVEETLRGNGHPHGCCGRCPCGPPEATPVYNGKGELEGYR